MACSRVDPQLQVLVERVENESLNVTQAAACKGLSYNAFRRLIAAGGIPTFEVAGQTRIWLADL
jgi:hypothetical protein